MADWHSASFWLFPGLLPKADVKVSSDAAGLIGYGTYMKGHWFAASWAPSQQLQSIAYKKLFPIVLAAHVWGHFWIKKHVLFCSDNNVEVHILNTRTSRVSCQMWLLGSLLFSAAHHSFSFSSQHVPGVTNQLPDALCRSFHIKQGFPDPRLANCLHLQRVVHGIKRCQGSSSSFCLPITDDLMLVIWRSLDLHLPDHLMFWAACSLGYLGFLHASEFTVPSLASFSTSLPSFRCARHCSQWISLSAPLCMRLKIKGSRTDPFRKGAFIYIGLSRPHSVQFTL